MRAVALTLTALVLLAGCVSLEDDAVAPSATTDDLTTSLAALVAGVPCEAAVGEDTSANLRLLDHLALDSHGEATAAEMWVQGDRAYVARYETGGFSIIDLTDPAAPTEVGVWDPESPDRALDVKALPDGAAAIVGGDEGLRIVDVRDPAEPRLEFELAFEKPQAHMLTVFTVEGEDYVAVSKGDGQDLPIYRVTGGPGDHGLELAASPKVSLVSQATGAYSPEDLTRAHDAFFFHDPLLDAPTLWVAHPWEGVVALDVSEPTAPEEIARIPNLKPQYTHTVQTVVLGERRVTVSVSEVGVNTMKVFDTTDLQRPRLLAEWSVRNAAQPQHNIQVVAPHIYVAHYTEGVLVFDLPAALNGTLEPVARLAAGESSPRPTSPVSGALAATGVFSGTWDVSLKDGLLYATSGGLQAAAFGCLTPGQGAATSVG